MAGGAGGGLEEEETEKGKMLFTSSWERTLP